MNFLRLTLDDRNVATSPTTLTGWYQMSIKMLKGLVRTTSN